ncbi:MAG TPA: hypothetical protein H9737_05250 [Candidatus Borkfalkia faecigallinarum]|uniref:UVR domain-containing protein n=1 Tax=Candidatus Borkfalkia faecigallinarum TaxID=2838509 RepID=A0A9D2AS32_9FIRM|nr:hypothetical protein [Candidatus Borkfalkia faecigallinarum]
MLCSNCKKHQATHLIRREGEREMALCDECFEKLGDAAVCFGDEPDFFVSFLQPEGEDGKEKRCPVCGCTFGDYMRTGVLGCAACYQAFRAELEPTIRRIHGKTVHEGKRPLANERMFRLLDEQKSMRSELERALREKRMKDADEINRALRRLNRMIYGDAPGGVNV